MPALLQLAMLFLMGMLAPTRAGSLATAALSDDDAAPNEPPAESESGPIAHQDPIVLPSSTGGYDRREIRGQLCTDGYTRGFTGAMMSGSGLCMVEGWASEDPRDCRVQVHIREAPYQSGVCYVTVYEIPN